MLQYLPMSENLIRVYQKLNFDELKKHLLIYGTLSGMCASCQEMNIPLEAHKCPSCETEFKYISFQNPKENKPKLIKIQAQRPSMVIVDYDDYKKIEGESNIKGLFND